MGRTSILSDGEWKLMSLLWNSAPKTVSQLVNDLKNDTAWTKGTVFMMLTRLLEKGYVRFEEQGRIKQYYPLLQQEEAAKQETETFLSKVYGGSLHMMVSSMVDHHALSREDIDELYQILKRAETTTK